MTALSTVGGPALTFCAVVSAVILLLLLWWVLYDLLAEHVFVFAWHNH